MEQLLNKITNDPENKELSIKAVPMWINKLKDLASKERSKEDIEFIQAHIIILENLLEMNEGK